MIKCTSFGDESFLRVHKHLDRVCWLCVLEDKFFYRFEEIVDKKFTICGYKEHKFGLQITLWYLSLVRALPHQFLIPIIHTEA